MSRSVEQNNLQLTVCLEDFTCPISLSLFFNPAQAVPCGHVFESQLIQGLVGENCPFCRQHIDTLSSPPPFFHDSLNKVLTQNLASYNEVYFDLTDFEKMFKQKNGLKTSVGERYITLLENAANHLNEAMGVLTSTLPGRDLLRKKLRIESGKYFFGNAEISPKSLETRVNSTSHPSVPTTGPAVSVAGGGAGGGAAALSETVGTTVTVTRTIREWLSMTTAQDVALEQKYKAKQTIELEAKASLRKIPLCGSSEPKRSEAQANLDQMMRTQDRFFFSRGVSGVSALFHVDIVYGDEEKASPREQRHPRAPEHGRKKK